MTYHLNTLCYEAKGKLGRAWPPGRRAGARAATPGPRAQASEALLVHGPSAPQSHVPLLPTGPLTGGGGAGGAPVPCDRYDKQTNL